MDWWIFAFMSFMKCSKEKYKVILLFLAGARTQMMMAKTASVMWANAVFKCRDRLLSKIKTSIIWDMVVQSTKEKED